MRKYEFADYLPRTFICFRCLEKKSNVQERSQTEEDQRLLISPSSTYAEIVEIPDTDTPPVKTMTVLQGAYPGTNNNETNFLNMERGPQEVANPERSVGSSGGTDVNAYCDYKLWWLSEGEV